MDFYAVTPIELSFSRIPERNSSAPAKATSSIPVPVAVSTVASNSINSPMSSTSSNSTVPPVLHSTASSRSVSGREVSPTPHPVQAAVKSLQYHDKDSYVQANQVIKRFFFDDGGNGGDDVLFVQVTTSTQRIADGSSPVWTMVNPHCQPTSSDVPLGWSSTRNVWCANGLGWFPDAPPPLTSS